VAQARLAGLRAEAEASNEASQKAALHHEIGVIHEELGNDPAAVKEYLAAFNQDPAFRPPLFALTRIFERRRSFANLSRLYDAEAKSAPNDQDRASATIDQAVLTAVHSGDRAAALSLFSTAHELDPTSLDAALMLEVEARGATDADLTARALMARAERAQDPVLKSLLYTELAWDQAERGELDQGFETIRHAIALPQGRYRALVQMERLARAHGRSEDLIPALEGQAVLALAAARGEDRGQGSGAFSVQRFSTEAKAGAEAAALLYEASRLRIGAHDDAAGAAHSLAQALAIRPDDVLLHQAHLLACELAGDLESAAAEAHRLLEHGAEGRFGASLHFRLAEIAQASGDVAGATAALGTALAADPGSAAVVAMLDDLLLDTGNHPARVAALEARGANTDLPNEARVQALWRAAQIAAEDLHDFRRARGYYDKAVSLADDKVAVLRELYGAAMRHGNWEAARDALRILRLLPVDEEERSVLWYDLHHVLRYELGDIEAADATLSEAIDVEACVSWAPDLLRIHAARSGDSKLLCHAHLALAKRAVEDETAAAHLSAAARSSLRAGEEDAAMTHLRAALGRSPGHRYAVALLEEILIARGEAEEAVALLREAAEAQAGARAAELNLLLAGAAAEASEDPALAAKTYEQAADQDPTSLAPLLALRRLAIRNGDDALLLRAREGLSERELGISEPGWATLELAEHYDLVADKPELAESRYRAALDGATVATSAAAALTLAPAADVDAKARIEAFKKLLDVAQEGPARIGLLRAIAAEGLHKKADAPAAEEAAAGLGERASADVVGAWGRILSAGSDGTRLAERADAWVALAGAAEDPETRAELVLVGLRAKLVAQGDDAVDDAFLLAQEIGAATPDAAASGVALDETLAAGDDAEARVEALSARLLHAGGKGGGPLEAAVGRALVAAGRPEDAMRRLRKVLSKDVSDLASWEALRLAAREAEHWEEVVRACDELAKHLEGELQAQLLEEAAAVLMDDLGRDPEAEERLRRCVEIDVARPIAFGRLHDLLAERNDTAALIDLVTKRIEALDEPEELTKLYYEQARLLRSQGDREAAQAALDNLLMLESDHVGGLALSVEIFVSLSKWAEAVECLRQLADNEDVPASQKRLSRLGAADFLEKKLGDPKGALAELEKLVELGLGDASLFGRMAQVAERASDWDAAVAALGRAAEVAEGSARADVQRKAAEILRDHISDSARAIEAYRGALDSAPTDLAAAEGIIDLVVDPVDRENISKRFEASVREELALSPTDESALRKLFRAAEWRGDGDLMFRALDILFAIGVADAEEATHRGQLLERTIPVPSGTLSPEGRALLRQSGDEAISKLAQLTWESVAEMDRLTPASYEVGRGDLVSPKKESSLRKTLSAWANALGSGVTDLYIGGTDARGVATMPGKKGPSWVIGDRVPEGLDAKARFLIAQLAFATSEGTLPLVLRTPDDAATVLFAAAAAGDAPLLAGSSRTGLAGVTKAIAKKMPRKVRKAIQPIANAIPDAGMGVPAFCETAHRAALRAGLVGAGELRVVLEALLGRELDGERVMGHAAARDLLEFWLSEDARGVRAGLGVSS